MNEHVRKAHDQSHVRSKVRDVTNPRYDTYVSDEHKLDARDTEHRYFSACMADNSWQPDRDGLSIEHFVEEPGMFKWFKQYARKSGGRTPPLSLVRQTYPAFEHWPGIDRRWLADRLMMLKDQRVLFATIRQAAERAGDEQIDAASSAMRDGLRMLKTNGHGIRLQDYVPPPDTDVVLPSLYKPLEHAGGLHRGSYSIIIARTNVGKSWRAMQHAVDLALGGEHVVLFSMEMDMRMTSYRLHMLLHGAKSHEWDWTQRNKEADKAFEAAGGSLEIEMPTHVGQLITGEYIARRCSDGQIAVIDHMGLMHISDGRSAREDHVVMSLVSRSLKEISQSDPYVTVLAVAQLNREGATKKEQKGVEVSQPELEQIGGSDKIAWDIDLAIGMRRNSKRVVSNYLIKNRYGPTGIKWYTLFDYENADFRMLDREEAYVRMDEDREQMQEGS